MQAYGPRAPLDVQAAAARAVAELWQRGRGGGAKQKAAEVGTVSDVFRLLGRECVCSFWFCVILEVRVHVSSPCGRSGDVRGRHAITFEAEALAGYDR